MYLKTPIFICCALSFISHIFALKIFKSFPGNASVISSGFSGVPPLIMDPNILVDEKGFHLFYSTYFCMKPDGMYYYSWDPHNDAMCSITKYISALGYAFSIDQGLNWEFRASPVFAPGGEEWEQYKVETAFVHNNGTTLQLYYSAIGNQNGSLLDNRYQLGVSFLTLRGRSIEDILLKSDETFQRLRTAPLIAMDVTTSSFTNNVQEPSVVWRNNQYEVYFLGIQFSEPTLSADAPGQSILLIGLGCAVFDAQFNQLSISTQPLNNTAWRVNIPEVRYSAETSLYTLVSSTLGDGGEVHHGEYLQLSYSQGVEGDMFADHWTAPRAVLKPQGGEVFNGWACTSPTLVLSSQQSTELVSSSDGAGVSPTWLFYSAFEANYTSNKGACDYSTRYGIGVPDPACLYIALGRAVSRGGDSSTN